MAPVFRAVRLLPLGAQDALRKWEIRHLTSRLSQKRTVDMTPTDQDLISAAARSGVASFVIVDDCVDTGASLDASLRFVRNLAGASTAIHTATLTVSLEDPIIRPDVYLYDNATVRGPWSHDF